MSDWQWAQAQLAQGKAVICDEYKEFGFVDPSNPSHYFKGMKVNYSRRSKAWRLYEPEPAEPVHDIGWAVARMREGKKVRRK